MKPNYDFTNKVVYVTKKFSFSAAHQIFGCKKCQEQLHGHNYVVEVTVKGSLNKDGFLIDLDKLESLINTHVIFKLDHSVLNDCMKPLNPTVELLAFYLFHEIETCLHICECTANLTIACVTVFETESYSATIQGGT
ncbi:6-pyruvoyl trahydropterin synthase family protein [Anaerosporobacter faecicola]|uniref:6-pyruvoyl trahydropterin synthase family protein n=1 Tax=Anaerosporobacter faecicola TaxID=2718714 RepID=UPI0014394755|nr:6-carboxytetrahydropterin synthase [Anaerosporobacter faecicola]